MTAIATSDVCELAALGHMDGTIQLVHVTNGEIVSALPEEHNAPIEAMRFTPDGQTLVTVSLDGDVRTRRVETLESVASSTVDEPEALVGLALTENGILGYRQLGDSLVRFDPDNPSELFEIHT